MVGQRTRQPPPGHRSPAPSSSHRSAPTRPPPAVDRAADPHHLRRGIPRHAHSTRGGRTCAVTYRGRFLRPGMSLEELEAAAREAKDAYLRTRIHEDWTVAVETQSRFLARKRHADAGPRWSPLPARASGAASSVRTSRMRRSAGPVAAARTTGTTNGAQLPASSVIGPVTAGEPVRTHPRHDDVLGPRPRRGAQRKTGRDSRDAAVLRA